MGQIVNRHAFIWISVFCLAFDAVATTQAQETITDLGASPSLSAAIRVEICEQGLNDADAWFEVSPIRTESFAIPAFGIDQIPPKYVDDGIRGTRPSPSLVRLSAVVELPSGRHRFLIRARSASRLKVNGTLVAETPFAPRNGGDSSQADTERLAPLDPDLLHATAARGSAFGGG